MVCTVANLSGFLLSIVFGFRSVSGHDSSAENPAHFVIAPYRLVANQTDEFKEAGFSKWGCVVLDEAHVAKTPAREVSDACKILCNDWAQHVVLATGTPMPNRITVR